MWPLPLRSFEAGRGRRQAAGTRIHQGKCYGRAACGTVRRKADGLAWRKQGPWEGAPSKLRQEERQEGRSRGRESSGEAAVVTQARGAGGVAQAANLKGKEMHSSSRSDVG